MGRVGDTRISQNSFIHWLRPPRFVSRFPEKDVCAQDLHIEIKNAGLLDPVGNPLPVKAKARLVIHGQHCPDNAQGLVRTDAPTVHRTAVSVFLQLVCRSLPFLRGKPREVEEPLFFEPPSRGLPIEIVKRCFWITPFSPRMVERTA